MEVEIVIPPSCLPGGNSREGEKKSEISYLYRCWVYLDLQEIRVIVADPGEIGEHISDREKNI